MGTPTGGAREEQGRGGQRALCIPTDFGGRARSCARRASPGGGTGRKEAWATARTREASAGGEAHASGKIQRGKRAREGRRARERRDPARDEARAAVAVHRIRMDGDRNWSSPPNGVLVLSSHLDAREDAESWCRNGFYIFCTLSILNLLPTQYFWLCGISFNKNINHHKYLLQLPLRPGTVVQK